MDPYALLGLLLVMLVAAFCIAIILFTFAIEKRSEIGLVAAESILGVLLGNCLYL